MEFHERFGHLLYDTVERLAKDFNSGIVLKSTQRKTCLTCTEGKQIRSNHPKEDTGQSAPTDWIGAFIWSDVQGTISPKDRNSNHYMIKFIDHNNNNNCVFLEATKDRAATMFQRFLVWFEKKV